MVPVGVSEPERRDIAIITWQYKLTGAGLVTEVTEPIKFWSNQMVHEFPLECSGHGTTEPNEKPRNIIKSTSTTRDIDLVLSMDIVLPNWNLAPDYWKVSVSASHNAT
jgi:hypothetical protein